MGGVNCPCVRSSLDGLLSGICSTYCILTPMHHLDVGLLIGVRVVSGVEHGQVHGAALLRVHPLVGHRGCHRRVLQRLPVGPGHAASAVFSVDKAVLN